VLPEGVLMVNASTHVPAATAHSPVSVLQLEPYPLH
jgi:hypothetical protein